MFPLRSKCYKPYAQQIIPDLNNSSCHTCIKTLCHAMKSDKTCQTFKPLEIFPQLIEFCQNKYKPA